MKGTIKGLRPFPELTGGLTTRTDISHATPDFISPEELFKFDKESISYWISL